MKKKEYDLILTDFDKTERFEQNSWKGNMIVSNINNIDKGY